MGKLSELQNVGKTLEKKLIDAGIKCPEELVKLGSKKAFMAVRGIDDGACFSMLCALEGAVQGIRWHNLEESKKQELKKFFEALKG